MRVGLCVLALAILGGAASAGAQSNASAPAPEPVVRTMQSMPPPPPPMPSQYVSPPTSSSPLPMPRGKSRVAIPAGNPGEWATSNDYPIQALREGREGITGFRIMVGPDGRPAGCDITSSSGSPDLDSVTCELLVERALFKPALDIKGKPTTGSYSSRVRWVIPKGPTQIEPSHHSVSFIVEADGTATNCAETRDGVPVEDSDLHSLCSNGTIMQPYTDAAGKPVRKRVVVTQAITLSDVPH